MQPSPAEAMQPWQLIQGDCLQVLATLPAESVQTCITSPPYWGLRDYGTAAWEGGDAKCDHKRDHFGSNPSEKQLSNSGSAEGHARLVYSTVCGKCGATRIDNQLGLEATPEAYVASMVAVFREVRRVLRDDGTLWLNLGDSYAGSANNTRGEGAGGGKDRGEAMGFGVLPKRLAVESGLKPKDLVGIPWRVAFALQADGWYLRQDIIWHKPNPMPESVTDRCTKAHEYIFLMTKSPRYFYDAEAVKEPNSSTSQMGGIYKNDAKYSECGNGHSGLTTANKVNTWVGRNRRSVWTVTTKPYKGAHFATFPPDLIEPCVLAGSADKCCPKCGNGWERLTESTKTFESGSGKSGNPIVGKQDLTASETNSTPDIRKGPCVQTRTVGFRPACNCGETASTPSTVLDPFNGAGTTGVVAIQHGRRYIGIELNPEYLEMARKRIQDKRDSLTMPMFAAPHATIPG